MKYSNKKRSKSLIIFASLLLVGVGAYAYTQVDTTDKPINDDAPESIVADPEFSDGTDREPMTTPARDGSITEDESADEPTNDDLEPTTSESGVISVISPQPNSRLSSGDRLSGSANVERVQYRLIDNNIGVIAQGSLSVKEGKFSGAFDFNSQGTQGRLDIFSYSQEGIEENQVEIDVRLK